MNSTARRISPEAPVDLRFIVDLAIRDAADANSLYERGLILKAELNAYLALAGCPCAQCNHS